MDQCSIRYLQCELQAENCYDAYIEDWRRCDQQYDDCMDRIAEDCFYPDEIEDLLKPIPTFSPPPQILL